MNTTNAKHSLTRTIACLTLACSLFAGTLALSGCGNQQEGWSPDSGQSLYDYNLSRDSIPLNDYDYASIEQFNDYRYYVENDEVVSQVGIDVSDHQGTVNWSKVAASGVDCAVLRAGYRGTTDGGVFPDETFAANLTGAKRAGLKVGAYFFSQATSEDEAREEASFLVSALDGAELDLPVVFDLEKTNTDGSRVADLTYQQATAAALAFSQEMSKAGYKTMIYLNKESATNLFDLSQLTDCTFWYAEYETSQPSLGFDFRIWQYSDKGQVYGIEGDVDLNIMFKEPW